MKKYDYLVVGAGLYGCTIAERLTSAGKRVLVIDKRDRIGGNCASINMKGIDVHLYGPHVFHTSDRQVWEYINKFEKFRQFTHKVLSYYNGNVYNFPINKKTIQDFNNNEKDRNIYDAFFREYSEKQWNCKFEDVPVQALKRIPIRENYNDSYFNDYYQAVPVDGYDNLFRNMLRGIDVELNRNFLLHDMPYLKKISHKIIYTGPINEYFFNYHGRLNWRSLRFEFTEKNIKDFQGISVMHYPEKKYDYTRITEFKHFNPFDESFEKDYTVYSTEYPDNNPEEPYYPIENEENIEKYLKYYDMAKKEEDVHFAGRLGTYKYNDMDVTIKNALTDFHKIIKGDIFNEIY